MGKAGKQAGRLASYLRRRTKIRAENKKSNANFLITKKKKERKAKNVVILYDYAGKFNKFHI